MRNISNSALAKISEREGTDPITLVQIFWSEDKSVIYGDRAFLPEIRGQLLNVSEIEAVINASEGSNSGSVNIRLNDTNNSLKNVFDIIDIHKRPVYILQWFLDLPLSDAFVVFDGVISSPIEYKEGERTLSFDVLSKIEDLEIGYSAEEGNFEYIPDNLVGKPWPMIFGTVLHVPALQVNEVVSGYTTTDTGIDGTTQGPLQDYVLDDTKNLTLLYQLEQECFTMAAILLGQASFHPDHGDVFNRRSDNPYVQQLYDTGTQYEQKGNEYLAERLRPFNTSFVNRQRSPELQANQLNISNGRSFPQKQSIIVTINGAKYQGYFEGDTFNIQSRTHPFTDRKAVVGPTQVIDRAVATEFKTDLDVQTFFYAVAGSTVSIGAGNTYPVWYIIGIPHLTNIVVLARKTNSLNKLVVPASYYTIVYKTFGTLQVTMLQMAQPLSAIDPAWEDNIWVNCTSPIGPNAVDILKYIITNYTNVTYDTTSFNSVEALIQNYKCGFALTDRLNSLDLIKEIAYQSRCAIWYKGGRFYLKYLPKQDAYVETITEDDIEAGTLEVFTTSTEDIVTKFDVSWRDRVDREPANRVIYRYNVAKYGVQTEDYDCFIYNNKNAVKKFALFWLIRKANTWKKIRFSTFLTKIRIEPFDSILLDFTYPWISNCGTPVIGIVEKATYDSDNHRIVMEVWTPIRLGEMCPYKFAYPSELSITEIFPQENDPSLDTNVPGGKVEDILYDQTPIVGAAGIPGSTPPNSGFGGDTTVSDVGDNTVDFNPPVELSPDSLINNGEPEEVTSISQRIIKPLDITAVNIPDGVYPGQVLDKVSGREYNVNVWFNGLSKPPTNTKVKQLQIRDDDTIPYGTYCYVVRNTARNTNGFIESVDYTMQVPVWLDLNTPPTVTRENVPAQDEGVNNEPDIVVPPADDEGDE